MTSARSSTDGRLARGAARREALIDAAFVVVGRDGVAGATHRTVAREAGLAVAAVSYHFGTIDDLFAAAMTHGTDVWRAALAEVPDGDGVRFLAVHLAAEVAKDRPHALAEYELYLLAARRPALRDAASAWMDVAMTPVRDGLDDVGRSVMESVIGGIFLQALIAEEPPEADVIEATLRRALGADDPGTSGA